jgi:uncharacterized membrane protein YbaN (DUF454 family)
LELKKESRIMQLQVIWLSVGYLALTGGLAGIVLPLVPTTPFLLLAAFAFARSSPALHDWLVTHPRFGPPIRNWNHHGAVSAKGKATAIAVMILMIVGSAVMGGSRWILVTQVAVMLAVAAFLLTRPSGPDHSA